jgi:hypothetical protein
MVGTDLIWTCFGVVCFGLRWACVLELLSFRLVAYSAVVVVDVNCARVVL